MEPSRRPRREAYEKTTPGSGAAGADAGFVWGYVERARRTFKGERQLEQYVARLAPEECAKILAASPITLPSLAHNYEGCRVGAGETRGFVGLMRTWALYVLSGLEGG